MRWIIGIAASLVIGVAYACTTTTVNTGDRIVICTTCCYKGNCTVTCF
jgi:hypothetical protein